jgi:PAS domain S-box-containing protein
MLLAQGSGKQSGSNPISSLSSLVAQRRGAVRFFGVPAIETSRDQPNQETIVSDREGVITHWGDECAKTYGYSAEEALGELVTLIIPPVLHERHWRGFNKAVSSGRLKRDRPLKVPAIHKSGAVLAVEGRLGLDLADDGTVDAVTLRNFSEGPGWRRTIWRAVLAVLKAGQAIDDRIRPASGRN